MIADGHLVWVLDGYTTSDKYPYSQSFDGRGRAQRRRFNYVRNSVKATVDAYDGTIKFYVVDQKDPIIQAYRAAFPQLFTQLLEDAGPRSRPTCGSRRTCSAYQTDVYRTYHMTNPTTFYNKADLWEVSPDPGSGAVEAPTTDDVPTPTTTNTPQAASSTGQADRPDLPPDHGCPARPSEQFLILRPFVPVSKGNSSRTSCRSWSRSPTRAQYGKLESFTMPTGNNTVVRPGPGEQHDPQHRRDLVAVHAAEPAGLARRPGQPAADPDRGLAALHPADLRRVGEPDSSRRSGSWSCSTTGTAVIDTTRAAGARQFPAFNGLAPARDRPRRTPDAPATTPTADRRAETVGVAAEAGEQGSTTDAQDRARRPATSRSTRS